MVYTVNLPNLFAQWERTWSSGKPCPYIWPETALGAQAWATARVIWRKGSDDSGARCLLSVPSLTEAERALDASVWPSSIST